MHPKEIRRAARVSQIQVAVRTGTSEPTVRLYEANQEAICDQRKRAALDAYYASLVALDSVGPEAA